MAEAFAYVGEYAQNRFFPLVVLVHAPDMPFAAPGALIWAIPIVAEVAAALDVVVRARFVLEGLLGLPSALAISVAVVFSRNEPALPRPLIVV